MKIETFFTSFLASANLSEIDNNELIKYSYELKNQNQGVLKSNAGGWQSDPLTVPNAEIAKLAQIIIDRIEKIAETWGMKSEKTCVVLENIWININPTTAFNRPHVHPGATFSGSYYVKCKTDGSSIVFHHPAVNFQYHINPDTVVEWNDFNSASIRYTPNEGDLIIFPAFLVHYVEPNRGEDDRISIAFNASIKTNE